MKSEKSKLTSKEWELVDRVIMGKKITLGQGLMLNGINKKLGFDTEIEIPKPVYYGFGDENGMSSPCI